MWENEIESSRNFLYTDKKVVGILNAVNKKSSYYEIESGLIIDKKQLRNEKGDLEDDYEKNAFKPIHSPNGNWTVYGDKNGYYLKNEKGDSPKNIQLQKAIEKNFLPKVVFSDDSKLLAFLGYAGNDYVKNLETFEDVPIAGVFIGDIKFSPSNTWLFSEHGQAIIYANTKTGKVSEIARCGNFGAPLLIFNEERVITGCSDGRMQFIDIPLGQEVFSIKAHDSQIIALKLSPDAKHLLTVSKKDGAKWWRLKF
jgi:WD40 repeat protein